MMESLPARIDLTAPVNYRVIRTILTLREPFTQLEVAQGAEAAPSQVSSLVRWLEAHQHVRRRKEDGRFETVQPASLVLAIYPYQRTMGRTLTGTLKVRGNPEEVSRILSNEGATLCLESALAQYSQFFRAERIAVYHRKPRKLLSELAPSEGGVLQVAVYEPDIPLKGDVEEPGPSVPLRRTTRYRTLVDLVCDNRSYAARDLFQELWGVRLG